MSRVKKSREKMAFSKKGWIANMIIVIAITVIAITHSFVTGFISGDSTIYIYLIPACWAELGVYSGFLLKKSEKENTKDGIIYDLAMKDKELELSEAQITEANKSNSQCEGIGDVYNTIEDSSVV